MESLKNLVNRFTAEKWLDRRDSARSAVEVMRNHGAVTTEAERYLWHIICTGNEDAVYWGLQVLAKTATLDFLVELIDSADIRKDVDKSRLLSDLLGFRFNEVYPYLLAGFASFEKESRHHIIRLLAKNGDHGLVDFFTTMTESDDPMIKEESIDFLGRFHDRPALEGLIRFLGDSSFNIKTKAAFQLNKGLEFLEIEGDRHYLNWFLPLVPNALKDSFLLHLSSRDHTGLMRLLESSDPVSRFILTRLLPQEDESARFLLDQPLAELQYLGLLCFKDLAAERHRDLLYRCLKSDFYEIRDLALTVCRESNLELECPLLEELSSISALQTRKIVLELIANSPDPRLFNRVREMALDKCQDLRFFSLYPLIKFYRYEEFRNDIFEILINSFKDQYWPVRNQSSLCFKYLGNEVVPRLISLIEHENNPDMLYWSISSMGQFDDHAIAPALRDFFHKTTDFSLHRVIIEVLGNFPGEESKCFFIDRIHDSRLKQVVLKSLHHMDKSQIEEIVAAGKVSLEELPLWIRHRMGAENRNGNDRSAD
ncbi:MAG: HEAT repeat domain-containing protein [Candidatus Wallbacteria bacterium]|nr:HEAT repeat domain-containing protein [Candidatus Wallbacteria bacterium]